MKARVPGASIAARSHLLVLTAIAANAGCAELPAMQFGVCGNGVIEKEAGEDCDAFSQSGKTRCALPGEQNQCRFTCAEGPDGTRPVCPSGMACATDGTCRAPSGTYSETGTLIASTPRELLTGDVDGDGRTDLVTYADDAVTVHYFDGSSALEGVLEMPSRSNDGESPVIGELTGDNLGDVVLPSDFGVVVMIGTQDRTSRPTAHAALTVRGVQELVLAPGQADPENPQDETVALGTINGGSGLAFVPLTGMTDVLTVMPGSASQLAGPIVMANLDDRTSSPCDEAVLSYRGDASLYRETNFVVYPLCQQDASGNVVLNHTRVWTVVDVGGAHIDLGAQALDVDRDGHLDLVVGVERAGQHEIDVAYGIGDGTFSSAPPNGSVTPGDNRAGFYGIVQEGPPLAVAWLDDDAMLDYVTANEVRVSRGGAFGSTRAAFTDDPFLEVVVEDVNANGAPDVVAIRSGRGVDFYNGTGDGRFALMQVPSQNPLSQLASADLDGDRVSDLVAVEHAPNSTTGTADDSISILFGRPWEEPEPPVSVGTLDPVSQIALRYSSDDNGVVDSIADFTTVSVAEDGTFVFSGFVGRSDRALRAAYVISLTEQDTENRPIIHFFPPMRLELGELTGDDHLDLVAIAHTAEEQGPPVPRLWLTPSKGEAKLLQAEASPSADLTESVAWGRSFTVAIDLENDGFDEIVTLAPRADDAAHGVSVVSRAFVNTDGSHTWEIADPVDTDFSFERIEEPDRPEGETRSATIQKADMNDDGRLDLVVLAFRGRDANRENRVIVFFNEGSGQLGNPVVVPSPNDSGPVTFTLLQADSDRPKEIAIVAGGAIYLADFHAEHHAFSVSSEPIALASDVTLVASGDFDGDGVDDLALGGGGNMSLLRGLAENP